MTDLTKMIENLDALTTITRNLEKMEDEIIKLLLGLMLPEDPNDIGLYRSFRGRCDELNLITKSKPYAEMDMDRVRSVYKETVSDFYDLTEHLLNRKMNLIDELADRFLFGFRA